MIYYSEALPKEAKELYWRLERAKYRVRALEAQLDRVDLDELDALLDQLQKARQEVHNCFYALLNAKKED